MPVPIITVAEMRQWEQTTWKAGRTEQEVISRVGHIVTQRVRHLTRPGDSILILAGKGHNGDDARHASYHLNDLEVSLINVPDPETGLKEFNDQLSTSPVLIVDGLFGIGLNRPLDEDWVRFIECINSAGAPILSIDVPSGLNAETGVPVKEAVRASITLTLGAPKRGLLSAEAWPYVGRLEVAPKIGLVHCPLQSSWNWTLPEDFSQYPPPRAACSHKGDYGRLVIFAGSLGYHGAAVLAARAALRARPGLITIITPATSYLPIASQVQGPMVHPWTEEWSLPENTTAILCGPGLAGADVPAGYRQQVVRFWRESPLPVIVDASALDWLPPAQSAPGIRIVTPHPGEAGRMLGLNAAAVQRNRARAVQDLSSKFSGAWVVLKGHQTVIGNQSGELFFNPSGNPFLAQGGSGDLLAGYMAGLLAQPTLQKNPRELLRYAVWQHGAAADMLQARQRNWTVEDLAGVLGTAE